MPYDRRHVVIQWGGTLPGGEIWSNSLRASSGDTGADADVPTEGELTDWLTGPLQEAVASWHSRATSRISTSAKLLYVKANAVDIYGHYLQENTLEYLYPSPLPGGSSAAVMPNQVALVVSLTTRYQRGPAHRGRFYSPLPSIVVGADGRIPAGEAQNVADSAATFITEAGDTAGPDFVVPIKIVVMSAGGAGGKTEIVTGVEVGRVLDTQRRRRTELDEDYQSHVVDQGAW